MFVNYQEPYWGLILVNKITFQIISMYLNLDARTSGLFREPIEKSCLFNAFYSLKKNRKEK